MLPTTATVPGASDLNLIQFIDVYLHGVSGPDEQEFAKWHRYFFWGGACCCRKRKRSRPTAEDIDTQLNKYLRASEEELASRGKPLLLI